jgi:hypothetical protein
MLTNSVRMSPRLIMTNSLPFADHVSPKQLCGEPSQRLLLMENSPGRLPPKDPSWGQRWRRTTCRSRLRAPSEGASRRPLLALVQFDERLRGTADHAAALSLPSRCQSDTAPSELKQRQSQLIFEYRHLTRDCGAVEPSDEYSQEMAAAICAGFALAIDKSEMALLRSKPKSLRGVSRPSLVCVLARCLGRGDAPAGHKRASSWQHSSAPDRWHAEAPSRLLGSDTRPEDKILLLSKVV